jgi:Toprim domain-containing protein
LKGRGFDRSAVERFQLGVVDDPLPEHRHLEGWLVIPYLTVSGPVDLKFRCTEEHVCKAVHGTKYLYVKGTKPRLFNARTLVHAEGTVVMTEGELDAVAVETMADLPAVAYPGAESWGSAKQRHWPRVFDGVDRIVVVADGDEPGRKAAETVATSLERAVAVRLPDGEDANSFLLQHGAEKFRELIGVQDA